MAILYVAAEAAELKPLAALLTAVRKLKWPVDYAAEGIWQSRRILLAANGAGPKLAADVVEIAIRAGMVAELSSSRLEAVISTGFCGALDPALRVSQIVVADEIICAPAGDRFTCAKIEASQDFVSGPLYSQNRVANTAEDKQELAASGAIVVDMEAAGVAARTKRAGLPFGCIKVVTDTAHESFGLDFNSMRSPEGRIARGKIVVHALSHPTLVPALLRLKRRTEDGAKNLGGFLVGSRIVAEAGSTTGEPAIA